MNINEAIVTMERNGYSTLYYGSARVQAFETNEPRNSLNGREKYKKEKILYCDDNTKISFSL